jgi:hypothetical protein
LFWQASPSSPSGRRPTERQRVGERAREWTKSNCFKRNAFAPIGRWLRLHYTQGAALG